MYVLKELVNFSTKRHFWVFGCNIQGENGFQKLQCFWLTKALMSPYILCKSFSF